MKWDQIRPAPKVPQDPQDRNNTSKLIALMLARKEITADCEKLLGADLPYEVRLAFRLTTSSGMWQLDASTEAGKEYLRNGGSLIALQFLGAYNGQQIRRGSQKQLDYWRAELWKFAESPRATRFDAKFLKWLLDDVVYCKHRLILSVWLTILMQVGSKEDGKSVDFNMIRDKMREKAEQPDFLEVYARDDDLSSVQNALHRALLQQNVEEVLLILFDLSKYKDPEIASVAVKQSQTLVAAKQSKTLAGLTKDEKELEMLKAKLAMLEAIVELWLMDYQSCEEEIAGKKIPDVKKALGPAPVLDDNFWGSFGLVLDSPAVSFYLGRKVRATKLLKQMKKKNDEKIALLNQEWDLFLTCGLSMQREIMKNCLAAVKEPHKVAALLEQQKIVTLLELCPECEELQTILLESMNMA